MYFAPRLYSLLVKTICTILTVASVYGADSSEILQKLNEGGNSLHAWRLNSQIKNALSSRVIDIRLNAEHSTDGSTVTRSDIKVSYPTGKFLGMEYYILRNQLGQWHVYPSIHVAVKNPIPDNLSNELDARFIEKFVGPGSDNWDPTAQVIQRNQRSVYVLTRHFTDAQTQQISNKLAGEKFLQTFSPKAFRLYVDVDTLVVLGYEYLGTGDKIIAGTIFDSAELISPPPEDFFLVPRDFQVRIPTGNEMFGVEIAKAQHEVIDVERRLMKKPVSPSK